MANTKFKRGDVVQLIFPNEPAFGRHYRISAMFPDNRLTAGRVDVCEMEDRKAFKAKRGIGISIKYLTKVKINQT